MSRRRFDESNIEEIRETDGIVYGLYKSLWMKNKAGHSCDINIPHTLVYCDGSPIAWYFRSSKKDRIMRKRKDNLEGKKIAAQFMARKDPSIEVCSWFSGSMTKFAAVQTKKKEKAQQQAYSLEEEEVDSTVQELALAHLPFERTQDLIDPSMYKVRHEQLCDGLLQKFVEPRESADHIIRATWSPTAAVFEKRTHRFMLNSPFEGNIENKISSFTSETATILNEHSFITSSALITQLEKQCDDVVNHLREVSGGSVAIAHVELFFKIDSGNKIWLLFCHNLKLDKQVLRATSSSSTFRTKPSYNSASAQGKGISLKDPTAEKEVEAIPVDPRPFICCMTGEEWEGRYKLEVTFKLLIQHWFIQIAGLPNEADRIHAVDAIPPSLRRANPNMTREYYLRHRASPSFLLSTALVCPKAAMELRKAALEDLPPFYACGLIGHQITQRRTAQRPLGKPDRSTTSQSHIRPTPSSSSPTRPQTVAGPQVFRLPPEEQERRSLPLMLKPTADFPGTKHFPKSPTRGGDSLTNTSKSLGTINEDSRLGSRSSSRIPGLSYSAVWTPKGLSGRSTSPFRSPSRNPILPRLGVDPQSGGGGGGGSPQHGNDNTQPVVSLHSSIAMKPSSLHAGRSGSGRTMSRNELGSIKELNAAVREAEAMTQKLIAEAKELLQEQASARASSSGIKKASAAGADSLPQLVTSGSGRRINSGGRTSTSSASNTDAQNSLQLPPVTGSEPAPEAESDSGTRIGAEIEEGEEGGGRGEGEEGGGQGEGGEGGDMKSGEETAEVAAAADGIESGEAAAEPAPEGGGD